MAVKAAPGLFLLFMAGAAGAAAAQTPLTYELVAEGLLDPLSATAPKGDKRVFVAEHGGVIKVVKNGAVLPAPFLDVQSKVPPPPAGESGFLGLAFHPDYEHNGFFYVLYTNTNFDTVVERYQASASNPDVADPASASLVMFVPQPSAYHKGGQLKFGPDGYLYIGLGDGGDGLSAECTGQNNSVVRGKILRIDVDSAAPYAIPPTNPFVAVPGAAQEIWQYGIRNPWRFTVDPKTGDLYIGDVGAATLEEIDYAPGGVGGINFGWPIMEGDICYAFHACAPAYPACGDPSLTLPIFTASHLVAPFPCAMIGGEVYRGCALPELQGRFFFTDYCDSRLRSFLYTPAGGLTDLRDHTPELAEFYPQSMFITSFGVDGRGELLFVYQATPDLDGKVYRMVPAQTPAGLADCDGNGFDDACEIAADADLDLNGDALLDQCQGLSADTGSLSVSQGGKQRLKLHAGPAFAGRVYILGGSITGTAGIPFGSVVIPLTLDQYTLFSIVHPGTMPLLGNLGVLGPSGEGLASFSAPPGFLSALVGLKAYHAYGLVTPSGSLDYASNYVSLSFEP
jgi:glucose/arabinose dehydrogenase